jgi:hyperosmotically inducible protein
MIMDSLKTFVSPFLVLLLVSALGCASTSTKESTGEYFDDSWITTKVKAALIEDSVVKATEVNVETFKGVVQLSGFVKSDEAMAQAVELASNIKGVASVKNDMHVK